MGPAITDKLPAGTQQMTPFSETDDLTKLVQQYFDLSTIGLMPHAKSKDVFEAQQFMRKFLSKITYDEKTQTYTVPIPWKTPKLPIQSMLRPAIQQLRAHTQILQKLDLVQSYNDCIQTYIEKGYIVEIPETIENATEHDATYMAHFGVISESKSTPLRIVYCCNRAGTNRVSLNSAAYSGVNLLPSIPEMILKSRCGKYLICTDLEKAFHSLRLKKEDQDRFRFLWYQNGNPNGPIKIFAFEYLLFGFISSPFILYSCLKFHLKRFMKIGQDLNALFKSDKDQHTVQQVAEILITSLYSDNSIITFDDTQLAMDFCHFAPIIMKLGNFKLSKFVSNNEEVLQNVEQKDKQAQTVVSLLGLDFHRQNDTLQVKVPPPVSDTKPLSKRQILRHMASIYDPLGFAASLTVFGQQMLQSLWDASHESCKNWDLPVSDSESNTFKQYYKHIREVLAQYTIDRNISCHQGGDITLHVFSDAATSGALGTVLYCTHKMELVHKATFLAAKYKLVNKKSKFTIPKLELCSIVLAKRLVESLLPTLSKYYTISAIRFYSDSTISLFQIQAGTSEDGFILRRLHELCSLTHENVSFHFVKGEVNVADEITRANTSTPIITDTFKYGPSFLQRETEWPPPFHTKHDMMIVQGAIATHAQTLRDTNVFMQMEDRVSSYEKMVRVTANCMIFVGKLIKRIQQRNGFCTIEGKFETKMTRSAILKAEMLLVSTVQKTYATNTYEYCKTQKGIKPSIVRQLRLFWEVGEDLIKVKTRIPLPSVNPNSNQARFPVFLPNCNFTKKLITHYHLKTLHGSINVTIAAVRSNFWLLHAKRTVQQALRKCVTCIRYGGRPQNKPEPPSFPLERLYVERPFHSITVDLTGAFSVKINNTNTKVYLAIFSSLATRFISAEICLDLSADSFLNCIRRQFARFGWSANIFCDNASNFKAGSESIKKLNDMITNSKCNEFFLQNRTKFHFAPAKDPAMNGSAESAVKLMKSTFKRTVHRKLLNWDEFTVLVAESCSFVNTRPLCANSQNQINDNFSVLTPETLVYGQNLHTFPAIDIEEDIEQDESYQPSGTELQSKWQKKLMMLSQFRKIFVEQYHSYLNERNLQKKAYFKSNSVPLKKGQIVLLADHDVRRIDWRLGRLFEPKRGMDEHVRSWSIHVHDPNCNCLQSRTATCRLILITRSIDKILPLPYDESTQNEGLSQLTNTTKVNTHDHRSSVGDPGQVSSRLTGDNPRPTRAAKQTAKQRIQQLANANLT